MQTFFNGEVTMADLMITSKVVDDFVILPNSYHNRGVLDKEMEFANGHAAIVMRGCEPREGDAPHTLYVQDLGWARMVALKVNA